MIKTFKLHKWKKYMWVLFDETRPAHGSGKEQDDFLPGLYPILDDIKNSRDSKRLNADVTISDYDFETANIKLIKIDDCRYNVKSDATNVEFIFLTNRIKKYFKNYPDHIYLNIQ